MVIFIEHDYAVVLHWRYLLCVKCKDIDDITEAKYKKNAPLCLKKKLERGKESE